MKSPTMPRPLKTTLIILAVIMMIAFAGFLWYFRHTPEQTFTNADFNISTYISPQDADHDGIDDQTDILASARAYLATNPKYQSKYYAGGYPNDGYGVCTDVVTFALKNAGYDLKLLLDTDVHAHPDAYDIDTPDANIDFRRVNNLFTYFQRHFLSLPTDFTNLTAWQGGDIVVYPSHIGIVSDRCNRDGIPLVLHHYSPIQATYEEDALTTYDQITGHFRASSLLN